MSNILLLSVSIILVLIVMLYIRKTKKETQLANVFLINFSLIILWDISLILQIIFSNNFSINPIYFDNIAYIGIAFLPVSLLFTGIIFANTKIKFKKYYLLLFIIPILSLILLWTNDYHHLFYEHYSTNLNETVYGSYFIIHTIYSYSLIAIGLLYLLVYSIRNSGFFSRQAILILLGELSALSVNVLGYLGIISISIYITPITFTITSLFIAFAIFKFSFLGATPIALQRIVDRISDSYIVINENNKITDFNRTLLNTFSATATDIRNKDLFALVKQYILIQIFYKNRSKKQTIQIKQLY